jgi:hypothetical protein
MPTTPPTIAALPTPPSRDDPANFAARGDAFLGALPTFRSETNSVASNVYANAVEAATAASTAAGQASAAAASASTASSQATAASGSASAASASATAASNSANAAAASFDAFDDRYLGSKAADPTVDNDGNVLMTGALYWNSVSNVMKAWDGTTWVAAYVPGGSFLTAADIGTLVQAYDADLNTWAGKTAPSGAAVGTTDTQTLTNKTIAFGSNTLTDVASTNTAQTLTNKTIAFGSNTLTDVASTNTTQTLTNKTISAGVYTGAVDQTGSVRGGITAVAALNIDCSAGNYFTKTINANSTFTVSNVPASRAYAFTLELTHTSGTVTWFSGVQWPGGTAPTLTTGKVHLFTFVTDDGGTSWRGAFQINYNS